MPLRQEEVAEAETAQHTAAHDGAEHVRVVAGPGTGKSATLEERVCWLLEGGIAPTDIAAVSFTRAAARDLETRITRACDKRGIEGDRVAVSTLHSLALRALRQAGVLGAYPAEPVVLQRWELRNIFEAEFGRTCGINGVTRPEEIRRDHEAFWSTGQFEPPNIIPPEPPITEEERERFNRFHRPRTQLYSCVLPGEVVARCVERMEAGTLDPTELLGIRHLIVDEFQDLNPMDLRFVHGMAERGAQLFVAGDDDQSLYAFRYATPEGIERFTEERSGCGDHTLHHCFRCAPNVLNAAQTLIRTYAADGRIEKNLVSLWESAEPPVRGGLGCWRLADDGMEARAIAESCQRLIAAGMNPREIMILLSSTRTQARDVHAALDAAAVPYSPVREEDITDTKPGRAAYAILSLVVDPMNYIAHRTLLGVRSGVGLGTCNDIATAVIANGRNFRELFYAPIPDGLVSARARRAIEKTAALCSELQDWSKDETLASRLADVCRLVDELTAEAGSSDDLRAFLAGLPDEMTVEEAHAYLTADKDDDRRRILSTLAMRLGQDPSDTSLVPDRVQVLTMHGAKGLSAQVVFIPGLEEAILPGEKRRPYPGLVLEGARMLFVSITRARVVCVLSYATRRFVNGRPTAMTASQFTSAVGKAFERRTGGISSEVAAQTVVAAKQMRP
jgi:DNA helicase-2/ATP-dependent DNA helicase PcrA